MSEKVKHRLSVLGVVLSVAGFYAGKAASFPGLQAVMAPSYVAAKEGIERIQSSGLLRNGQPGFSVLARLIENELAKAYPQIPRDKIVLENLEATGGGIQFGVATSRPSVGLRLTFRNQTEPVPADLTMLAERVEEMWTSRSLWWSQLLFWGGVLLTAASIFAAKKQTRMPIQIPPSVASQVDTTARS